MHKCIVRGCTNKIDDSGYPEVYCDYQQGRCPMQRRLTGKVEIWLTLGMALCIAILLAAIT